MKKTMKAAVLYGKNDLRYEECPMPEVKAGQVKIRIKAAGICGSDVPRVLADAAWFYPIVLGHEMCGEVVEVAPDVTSVRVGERVTCAPHVPCFKCRDCQNGYYGSCRDYSFIGSKQQGGFAEYVVVNEINVVKHDQNAPYQEVMMFEPATVGCHGIRQAEFKGGSTVAILGCGTVGIFTAQWVKAMGARNVVVFDIAEERLELARKLGCDATVNSKDEDWKARTMELTDGLGFEYIFETAGTPATMKMSYYMIGTHGTICMIGYPSVPVTFEPDEVFHMIKKEFKVVGSRMSFTPPFPGPDWTLTAEYFSRGALKFDPSMIYKEMRMDQINEAFDLFRTSGQVKGKVLLVYDWENALED